MTRTLAITADDTPQDRDVKADLLGVIERWIIAHPRSQQVEIGPSEVGTPCDRKLGHKLAETPEARPETPGWRPTVGTAVHTWAADKFSRENGELGWDRWIVEHRVTAGSIGGRPFAGSCDLYDRLTATVIDWKFPGITTIRDARKAKSPGQTYQVQAHIYGLGYLAAGYPVRRVAVFMLPAAGELGDGYYWEEDFNPTLAAAAIAKADGLAAAIAAAGADVIVPTLAMAADHCAHCSWWMPGATDLTRACPGLIAPPEKPAGPAFGRLK